MKNNLTALLEKWQPGAAEKKDPKQSVADSGSFDLDAIEHFEQQDPVPKSEAKVESKKPAGKPEDEQNPFELNDDEIMEFFSRVEASNADVQTAAQPAHPVPARPEPKDIPKAPAAMAAKEDLPASVARTSSRPIVDEEEFREIDDAEKADRVFLGGVEDIPDKSTGDVLQNIDRSQEARQEEAKVQDWAKSFPWDTEVTAANKTIFLHESFRENQREIINAAKSKKDVLGVLQPGSGKSLTYQICAVTDEGITFVIMPTLSKISDQSSTLTFVGVDNLFFRTGMDIDVFRGQLIKSDSKYKVVFLTPEKLAQTQDLLEALHNLYTNGRIARFVITGAHCISQWGWEHKPEYLNLSVLREQFPSVPILALTSAATVAVKEDICKHLKLSSPVIIQGKLNRENLYYETRAKARMVNVANDIGNFIKKEHSNDLGLIYCSTRKDCEELVKVLKTNYKLACEFYHAGLPKEEKTAVHKRWTEERIKVLVTTSFSGIGTEKPNVRFVIHHAMPRSIRQYMKDCCLVGRDGQFGHCLMYYDIADKRTHEFLLLQDREHHENVAVLQHAQEDLQKILDYCEEQFVCRRHIQQDYFGEPYSAQDCKDMCDNCRLRKPRGAVQSFQKEAGLVVELVKDVTGRKKLITLIQAADYLHGKNKKKLEVVETPAMERFYGGLKQMSLPRIRSILLKLLLNKVLKEDLYLTKQGVTTYLGIGKGEKDFYEGKITIRLMVPKDESVHKKGEPVKIEQPPAEKPKPLPSRVYYAAKSKGEAAGPSQSAKSSVATFAVPRAAAVAAKQPSKSHYELKAKLKDTDVDDILDRLIYVKNRLLLRNKGDEKLIAELFPVPTLMVISRSVPRDLSELRLLVETKKWSAEEERVFVKYGTYFSKEITHYLHAYVPGSEADSAIVEEVKRETAEYSLKDYEPFAELLAEGFDEDNIMPAEGGNSPGQPAAADSGQDDKRTHAEAFKPAPDKAKRYKKDNFL